MRRNVGILLSALVVSASVVGTIQAQTGDEIVSGVAVGDFVAPFDVADITGPNKGKTLCYR
jgi:hypothetical protein